MGTAPKHPLVRPYTTPAPPRDADSLFEGRNVAGCQFAANELLFVKKARCEVVHAFFTRVELADESLGPAFCDEVEIDKGEAAHIFLKLRSGKPLILGDDEV